MNRDFDPPPFAIFWTLIFVHRPLDIELCALSLTGILVGPGTVIDIHIYLIFLDNPPLLPSLSLPVHIARWAHPRRPSESIFFCDFHHAPPRWLMVDPLCLFFPLVRMCFYTLIHSSGAMYHNKLAYEQGQMNYNLRTYVMVLMSHKHGTRNYISMFRIEMSWYMSYPLKSM